MTLLHEVAESERVAGGVSRGEALVRHVEEGEQRAFLQMRVVRKAILQISISRPTLQISEISAHCSGVGSTPVGLCAHA